MLRRKNFYLSLIGLGLVSALSACGSTNEEQEITSSTGKGEGEDTVIGQPCDPTKFQACGNDLDLTCAFDFQKGAAICRNDLLDHQQYIVGAGYGCGGESLRSCLADNGIGLDCVSSSDWGGTCQKPCNPQQFTACGIANIDEICVPNANDKTKGYCLPSNKINVVVGVGYGCGGSSFRQCADNMKCYSSDNSKGKTDIGGTCIVENELKNYCESIDQQYSALLGQYSQPAPTDIPSWFTSTPDFAPKLKCAFPSTSKDPFEGKVAIAVKGTQESYDKIYNELISLSGYWKRLECSKPEFDWKCPVY